MDDDDEDKPLTEENRNAAREVMARFAHFEAKLGAERAEAYLGQLHQLYGDCKFRLYMGLRKPRNRVEELSIQLFQGQISEDELRQQLYAYVTRPVDSEMLTVFFEDFQAQVERYKEFYLAVLAFALPNKKEAAHSDEVRIARLAARIEGKFRSYKEEIETVMDFLEEARIEKHMGIANLGTFAYPSACELLFAVCRFAQQTWESSEKHAAASVLPNSLYQIDVVPLFVRTSFKKLPGPPEAMTLLNSEYAAARVYLREREPRPAPRPVEPASPSPPAGDRPAEVEVPPLLRVSNWGELGIGIDERHEFWGITPVPDAGGIFEKSRAVKLKLPGKRWKAFLVTIANAPDPARIPLTDLLAALNRSPPAAHQLAQELAYYADLRSKAGNVTKPVADAARDLGRDLRLLVEGPSGRGSSPFPIDGDELSCALQVKYLIRDESGRLRFGPKSV